MFCIYYSYVKEDVFYLILSPLINNIYSVGVKFRCIESPPTGNIVRILFKSFLTPSHFLVFVSTSMKRDVTLFNSGLTRQPYMVEKIVI